MRKTKLRRSALAVLLAMIMLLPAMPGVRAANDARCELCDTVRSQIVLKQANCHEQGVVEYICVNSKCAAYQVSVLAKTDIDPDRHDTICTDNGDGATHTAHCIYHSDYVDPSEEHSFVNAYCTKCAAADYSQAEIIMDGEVEIHVDLGDKQASLSVGKVSVKVGNVDVSRNYEISYSWADSSGTVVGTGETFILPEDLTAQEGKYVYGCYVMAMPKDGMIGKYISASSMITVCVQDMISAGAIVGSGDDSFTLGSTNSATSVSVSEQIYQAIYDGSDGYLDYVIFEQPAQSDVGKMKLDGASRYYYTATGDQKKLAGITFTPTGISAGTYTVKFTAYDTNGKAFPGALTINVERELGSMDVTYFTRQREQLDLRSEDFADFWEEKYPGGTLKQVTFKTLPAASQGLFYYNYNASLAENTLLKESDMLHVVLSNVNQYLIDGVSFIPAGKYTGQIVIPFTMYGLNSKDYFTQESGELSIFVDSGDAADIEIRMTGATAQNFCAEDFMTVYKAVTGKESGAFSIRLLDVPKNGTLYMDYTGTTEDTALNGDDISDHAFYYNSELSREIEDLTYVSDKSLKTLTDTLRYLACDEKGEFLYMGEIVFICERGEVVYTKSFADVSAEATGDQWFYTEVMDLAELGIISGYEEKIDGETVFSYKPTKTVTYGEALKMIMLAVGYEEQAKTSSAHWASGYLDKAINDKLVSAVLTYERLDEPVSRRMIAQIVARAMNLPKSTRTQSPFSDVPMNSQYISYILSVYDAGIMIGNADGTFGYEFNKDTGKGVFTRAQMAVVVWRIYNYEG